MAARTGVELAPHEEVVHSPASLPTRGKQPRHPVVLLGRAERAEVKVQRQRPGDRHCRDRQVLFRTRTFQICMGT